LRLLDLLDIKGKRAKQVNFLPKAYYSHTPVSQEYFGWWIKVQGTNSKGLFLSGMD